MKKYIYSFAALLVLFLSACTNDDIEIEQIGVAPTGDLTVSVSTQSVYDDFGVADEFKTRFLSGSYNIGLYTFVYDEAGNLAASDSVYTQTFGKISQEFKNLKEGNYTSITLEMLVDADHDYQSDNWVIVGKDKLSTLEIVNKNNAAYWYSAVGVATHKFQVEKNKYNSVAVTPKGIGSIIDTRMTNFDQSEYKSLTLFTKNQPLGRYLDPNLLGDDRFHYGSYTAEREWTHRGYVFKSEISSIESPTIYLLEESRINYCFGARKVDSSGKIINSFIAYPDRNSYFTFEDGKRYYAGFHYVGNDLCEAGIFNTELEYNNWYNEKTSPIPYLDYLLSYDGPFISNFSSPSVCKTWGASVNIVQSNMRGLTDFSLCEGANGKAVYVSDNVYEIAYMSGNHSIVAYSFTSETSGLFETDILYPKSMFKKETIIKYLDENYKFMASQGDVYMYMTQDNTTIVMFFPHLKNEKVWDIGFVDKNYISQSPALASNKALMSKAMNLQK